jgi:hypothetical protein
MKSLRRSGLTLDEFVKRAEEDPRLVFSSAQRVLYAIYRKPNFYSEGDDPLFGIEMTLSHIISYLEAVATDPKGASAKRALLLMAPPGVGKTRTVEKIHEVVQEATDTELELRRKAIFYSHERAKYTLEEILKQNNRGEDEIKAAIQVYDEEMRSVYGGLLDDYDIPLAKSLPVYQTLYIIGNAGIPQFKQIARDLVEKVNKKLEEWKNSDDSVKKRASIFRAVIDNEAESNSVREFVDTIKGALSSIGFSEEEIPSMLSKILYVSDLNNSEYKPSEFFFLQEKSATFDFSKIHGGNAGINTLTLLNTYGKMNEMIKEFGIAGGLKGEVMDIVLLDEGLKARDKLDSFLRLIQERKVERGVEESFDSIVVFTANVDDYNRLITELSNIAPQLKERFEPVIYYAPFSPSHLEKIIGNFMQERMRVRPVHISNAMIKALSYLIAAINLDWDVTDAINDEGKLVPERALEILRILYEYTDKSIGDMQKLREKSDPQTVNAQYQIYAKIVGKQTLLSPTNLKGHGTYKYLSPRALKALLDDLPNWILSKAKLELVSAPEIYETLNRRTCLDYIFVSSSIYTGPRGSQAAALGRPFEDFLQYLKTRDYIEEPTRNFIDRSIEALMYIAQRIYEDETAKEIMFAGGQENKMKKVGLDFVKNFYSKIIGAPYDSTLVDSILKGMKLSDEEIGRVSTIIRETVESAPSRDVGIEGAYKFMLGRYPSMPSAIIKYMLSAMKVIIPESEIAAHLKKSGARCDFCSNYSWLGVKLDRE